MCRLAGGAWLQHAYPSTVRARHCLACDQADVLEGVHALRNSSAERNRPGLLKLGVKLEISRCLDDVACVDSQLLHDLISRRA